VVSGFHRPRRAQQGWLLLGLWLWAAAAWAGPPAALTDRTAWPEGLRSPEGFDRASRAELLVFAEAFAAVDRPRDAAFLRGLVRTSAVSVESAEAWKARTRALHAQLSTLLAPERPRLFRPPYGQRSAALLEQLHGLGVRSVLWNIDSQDWQAQVTPPLAAGRVVTLMLLWRRGILLFHDPASKALHALPHLWAVLGGSGVTWLDCRTL